MNRNYKKILSFVICNVLLLLFLAACSNKVTEKKNSPVEIHFSAAASLKDALTEITNHFQKENPNIHVLLNFGGSGALREQVLAGAPIDGVLFASKKDTDALVKADKLTDVSLALKNSLVLITNKKKPITGTLKEILEKAQTIAIGKPKTVPAGRYADETLTSLGLKDALKSKFVQAADVRQVLSYVEAGNADCGFVYKTDALLSSDVSIAQKIPNNDHKEIAYYLGIVKDTKEQKKVAIFNQFIKNTSSQKIFKKYGFSPVK